jgi:signal transduction histidine kinase
VIQTDVEAVLATAESTPAERREATAVVTRATERMSRLLDDLLATARKRSSAYVDRDVDLAGLARNISAEYALLAAERSLQLELRLASGPVAYADPASLDRAVSNLLSNAVRLAPEGSTITVAAGSQQGWAWVAVRDEGPGITEEDRHRIGWCLPSVRAGQHVRHLATGASRRRCPGTITGVTRLRPARPIRGGNAGALGVYWWNPLS